MLEKTVIVCRIIAIVFVVTTYILLFTRNAEKEVEVMPEDIYIKELPLVKAEVSIPKEEVKEEVEKVKDIFIANLDIPLDIEYQEHLHNECKRIGVSEAYMYALIESESTFRTGVKGDGGASFGLCQIKSVNYPEMEEMGLNPGNEFDCMTYAITLIRRYMDKYADSLNLMNVCTTCYKCGEAGAKRNNYYLQVCDEIEERTEYYENLLR